MAATIKGHCFMRAFRNLILGGVLVMGLAACGNTPGQRALSGAGLGAAGGAVIGAATGGSVLGGALLGGAGGAAVGALTTPSGRLRR